MSKEEIYEAIENADTESMVANFQGIVNSYNEYRNELREARHRLISETFPDISGDDYTRLQLILMEEYGMEINLDLSDTPDDYSELYMWLGEDME